MAEMSVRDAAAQLAVSEQYVGRLLSDGRLLGERRGRSWAVDGESVAKFRTSRSGGQRGVRAQAAPPPDVERPTTTPSPAAAPAPGRREAERFEDVLAERDRLRGVVAHLSAALAALTPAS